MAFGFGFNKQKALSTAEKYVQQGKLQNAISEYEKVLKAEPKELTVLNTVGDLHARLGHQDQAVECFKSVGDAYASQGFTVKAIAMYKKLGKLKPSLDSVLRLAELYTQQGLFNDARAQYRQVAEEFLRTGELEQAARIFQKTLEMDPENVAMRTRLAEVYVRLGKKTEAWQIFSEAAETLRNRGATAPAEELLQRMLTLDPGNSSALLLRGRIAFESGDLAGAIQQLEKIADLDSHPEGLRVLMQAYVRTGRLPEAGTLVGKLFSVHNDVESVIAYADALISSGHFEDALRVFQQYSERLLASNSSKVLDTLHACIGHVRENTAALQILLDLLIKSGDNTHLAEVYELLAHSCVQSGDLERARDYYLKLTQLEPQNQIHARNYQQVVAQLGGATGSFITAEEGASLIEEMEATAPFIEQRYPDDVALAVRSALTDADLFLSYNMPAKALEPLQAVLLKAPSDLRLNQRLAALHTRAGRFAEAASCCATLSSIYHDAGYAEEAARYSELAERYKERAAMVSDLPEGMPGSEDAFSLTQSEMGSQLGMKSAAALGAEADASEESSTAPATAVVKPSGLFWHAPAAAWPETPAEPPAQEKTEAEVSAPEAAVEQEIDLSDEWEGALSEDSPIAAGAEDHESAIEAEVAADHSPAAAAEPTVDEMAEEIRFYLGQSMADEARKALAKLRLVHPDAAIVSELQAEIEASVAGVPAHSASGEAESISEPELEEAEAMPSTHDDSEAVVPASAAPASHVSPMQGFVSDLESSLGEGFLPGSQPTPARVEPLPQVAQPPAAAASAASSSPLGSFVADLEGSLGDSFLPSAPPPQPKVAMPEIPQAQAAMAAAASGHVHESHAQEAAAFTPAFTYQPRSSDPANGGPKVDAGLGVDLAGMFGELRQELEADSGVEEDCETHYNLGVAFREMGLLDEAIGEFQKVCQAADRGKAFPQLMQAYTWLAQCFLDKGVPQAAVRWYERALTLPNLDAETNLALHYELASSYEAAHNKSAALNHFLEVYGINIDYRDVAERIQALKS
jgi:tetratricopeptide (TPR) repeat protein